MSFNSITIKFTPAKMTEQVVWDLVLNGFQKVDFNLRLRRQLLDLFMDVKDQKPAENSLAFEYIPTVSRLKDLDVVVEKISSQYMKAVLTRRQSS